MRKFLVVALSIWASAAAADIQPRSGQWAGVYNFVDAAGCPAQMVAQMQAAPPQMRSYTARIDFPDPFDPRTLQQYDASFLWRRVGPDVWAATHTQAEDTGMGRLTTVSNFTLRVLSDTQMHQDAELILQFPPQLVAMLGMDSETCVTRSQIQHAYQGE